jgi:hypothetical protein
MLKELSDTHFPQASKIVLVQDNLTPWPDPITTPEPMVSVVSVTIGTVLRLRSLRHGFWYRWFNRSTTSSPTRT